MTIEYINKKYSVPYRLLGRYKVKDLLYIDEFDLLKIPTIGRHTVYAVIDMFKEINKKEGTDYWLGCLIKRKEINWDDIFTNKRKTR